MKRHLTVFWISPLRGQMRRLHLRWQTFLLGFVILCVGIGLGIGGVLWYQSRMKRELFTTMARIEEMRKNLLVLEAQKKEQEARLEYLTKEAENVLNELHNLRELEQKVRELMEKSLQSQLKRLGVTLSLSTSEVQTCIPLHRFLGGFSSLPRRAQEDRNSPPSSPSPRRLSFHRSPLRTSPPVRLKTPSSGFGERFSCGGGPLRKSWILRRRKTGFLKSSLPAGPPGEESPQTTAGDGIPSPVAGPGTPEWTSPPHQGEASWLLLKVG